MASNQKGHRDGRSHYRITWYYPDEDKKDDFFVFPVDLQRLERSLAPAGGHVELCAQGASLSEDASVGVVDVRIIVVSSIEQDAILSTVLADTVHRVPLLMSPAPQTSLAKLCRVLAGAVSPGPDRAAVTDQLCGANGALLDAGAFFHRPRFRRKAGHLRHAAVDGILGAEAGVGVLERWVETLDGRAGTGDRAEAFGLVDGLTRVAVIG